MLWESSSILCSRISKSGIHSRIEFSSWVLADQRHQLRVSSQNADISMYSSWVDADRSFLRWFSFGSSIMWALLDSSKKNMSWRLLNIKKRKSSRWTLVVPMVPNTFHLFFPSFIHKIILYFYSGKTLFRISAYRGGDTAMFVKIYLRKADERRWFYWMFLVVENRIVL